MTVIISARLRVRKTYHVKDSDLCVYGDQVLPFLEERDKHCMDT
jgi:hypothetical protein